MRSATVDVSHLDVGSATGGIAESGQGAANVSLKGELSPRSWRILFIAGCVGIAFYASSRLGLALIIPPQIIVVLCKGNCIVLVALPISPSGWWPNFLITLAPACFGMLLPRMAYSETPL